MGGKGKGNSFEREMNRELSLWFTSGQRDDIFCRTNSSGGRFTQRRKAGKDTANQSGDCTFADPMGELLIRKWSIEFKTGYSSKKAIKDADGKTIKKVTERWGVLDFLDSHKKETVFEMMWRQCQNDAEAAGKTPVLIFRRNGRPACIAIWKHYMTSLISFFGHPPIRIVEIKGFSTGISIMNLKDFFRWIPDIRPAIGQQRSAAPKTRLKR